VSALVLMRDLEAAGVVLEVRGDRLHVDAPAGMVTPDMRASLARHKGELLAMLAADPAEYENWAPLDQPVVWTERPDVITVVEDFSDEGMRPGRISRELGLTCAEVITILRKTGDDLGSCRRPPGKGIGR
jgi:TubC N-terminal docking domain